ncbi:MAG: hypothetical protein CL908_06570 [Deltaproteobacteria bacterium]|nr:hypothetical protein [Deltaproteobacteria bacterium]
MALEGQVLGDFRVLHEIGRGGMGIVYLAEQISLSRKVALKVLPHGRALSEAVLHRFRREAEAASRLDHPLICAVFATGSHEGIPYIAMRYVEGRPLSQVMREKRSALSGKDAGPATNDTFRFDFDAPSGVTIAGEPPASLSPDADGGGGSPLTDTLADEDDEESSRTDHSSITTTREDVRWAVRLTMNAARALHVAHEARVIHRDIKPSNIMVTPEQDPVLLDFGLARSLEGNEEGPSLTQSGDVMGTPHYMSPEQISGASRVDARTDVYSLGVTLYELIAGRRPFEAPNREQLYRTILTGDATPVNQVNSLVERDLEVVLQTALERDLDRRYQTARAFADDLRAVLDSEPIAARPLGLWLRGKKWFRRNPRIAVSGIVVFIALVALLVQQYFYSSQLEHKNELADRATEAMKEAKAKADRSAADERAALRRAEQLVRDLGMSLDHAKALQLAAEATSRAATDPALALGLAIHASQVEVTAETDRALRIALAASPEERLFPAPRISELAGGSLPTARRQRSFRPGARPLAGGRRASRTASDRMRSQTPPTGDVHWGTHRIVTLAGEKGGVPVVWDVRSGEVESVLAAHGQQVFTARFSPDGRRAVTAGEDGTVRVFDVASGKQLHALLPPIRRFIVTPRVMEYATFDSHGRSVIGVTADLVCVWRWNASRGQFDRPRTQTRYRAHRAPPIVRGHPKFPLVASAATDRVLVWTAYGTRNIALRIPDGTDPVSTIAWSPVGRRLAVADHGGRIAVWDLPSRAGENARVVFDQPLHTHDGTITCLAFSPDGAYLASGGVDRRLSVWDMKTKQPHWRPWRHEGSVTDIVWSEDGQSIATGSADHVARVFRANDGAVLRKFAGHPDWVARVAFVDGDRALVTFSFDGSARVFSVSGLWGDSRLATLPREVTSVEWSPRGASLLVGCRDGKLRLFDLTSGRVAPTIITKNEDLRGGRFLPDGEHVLSLTDARGWLECHTLDGESVWKVTSAKRGRLPAGPPRGLLAATQSGQFVMAVGPAGLPTVLNHKGEVQRELTFLREPLRCLVVPRPGRDDFLVWSAQRAPSIFALPKGFRWCELPNPKAVPAAAEFSSDGRYLVVTDSTMMFVVYDLLAAGNNLRVPWIHVSPRAVATAPAWLPDQPSLVLAPKDDVLQIVSMGGDGIVQPLSVPGSAVQRARGIPGHHELLLVVDGEILLWDLDKDRARAVIPLGSARLEDWDLSPDGQTLALGFADGLLRVIHLNAIHEAARRPVRPLMASEMERFELGTPEERLALREAEDALLRIITLDALRGRATYSSNVAHNVAYARRILDVTDPVKDRYSHALQAMEKVVKLETTNPSHLQLLAYAYYHNGRTPDAISTIKDALARVPERAARMAKLRKDLEFFERAATNGNGR